VSGGRLAAVGTRAHLSTTRTWRGIAALTVICAASVVASSCADGLTEPPVEAGASLVLMTAALPVLDAAREGAYEAWVIDSEGRAHSAGRFVPPAGGAAVTLTSPVGGVQAFQVTVERPGDVDDRPSEQRLLRGEFAGRRAELTVVDVVTHGAPFRKEPGTFTMFTPSDNGTAGYPSHEEAGIWLFNMQPRVTPQNDMWVRLTQLRPGWTYEGWMVRDYGAPDAIWLSYGKFTPDQTGAVSQRDDTGWGPFSGVTEFRTAGVEDFPGDDWISNPLGYPFPAELTLPLNLRERDASGRMRWTHVITVEPASDGGEAIGAERPFLIRPYRDAFGDAGPGMPRFITYRTDDIPRGLVEVR